MNSSDCATSSKCCAQYVEDIDNKSTQLCWSANARIPLNFCINNYYPFFFKHPFHMFHFYTFITAEDVYFLSLALIACKLYQVVDGESGKDQSVL